MKQFCDARLLAGVGIGVIIGAGTLVVGGPLQPPAGPVAPTYKTLDEVEPSTPIESLPSSASARYVISEPGRYHLTGNLDGQGASDAVIELAIDPQTFVASPGVTIDLRGFAIDAVFTVDHAISAPNGAGGLVVRNGRLARFSRAAIDAPLRRGVLVEGLSIGGVGSPTGVPSVALGDGAVVRDVRLADSGPIHVGEASTVERLNAVGMRALVRTGGSSVVADVAWATRSGGPPTNDPIVEVGDASTVERLHAIAGAVGATIPGVVGGDQTTVRDCSFREDGAGAYGGNTIVSVGDQSLVEGVRISDWGRLGINAGDRSVIRDSRCERTDASQPTEPLSTGIGAGDDAVVERCGVVGYQRAIVTQRGRVSGCVIELLAGANRGIVVQGGLVADNVIDSTMDTNGRIIDAGAGAVVRGNTIRRQLGEVGEGILVTTASEIRENHVLNAPISVAGTQSVVDANTVTPPSGEPGIIVLSTDCVVTRNRVATGSGGYSVIAGGVFGTVRTSTTGAGPWDNFEY